MCANVVLSCVDVRRLLVMSQGVDEVLSCADACVGTRILLAILLSNHAWALSERGTAAEVDGDTRGVWVTAGRGVCNVIREEETEGVESESGCV